jgi:hypothetical protein
MAGEKFQVGRRHAIEWCMPEQKFNDRCQRITSHRRF